VGLFRSWDYLGQTNSRAAQQIWSSGWASWIYCNQWPCVVCCYFILPSFVL